MAFNPSALEAYVQDASREIATKAVAEAKTASLLIAAGAVTAGVKGSALIQTMDADVNFQDGSACGRSPLGNVTLGDIKITVSPIKDEQDFCNKSLYNSWYSQLLAKGQNPETETLDASFAQSIMDLRASKIAKGTEDLIWKGDTALTGANNLKYIDGILKQVAGNIELTETGANVIAKLQSLYKQYDITVRKQEDFRIFIGEDLYEDYLIELDNANKFRPGSEGVLAGTTAKFEVVSGLNGTGKVIGTRISNLHLGMDGTDDSHKAEFRYSMETKKWYQDFHFSVGVKVIYADQVYVATI
jgi:hypothetical protein